MKTNETWMFLSMTVKYVDPKIVVGWALLRSYKTLLVKPHTKG